MMIICPSSFTFPILAALTQEGRQSQKRDQVQFSLHIIKSKGQLIHFASAGFHETANQGIECRTRVIVNFMLDKGWFQ